MSHPPMESSVTTQVPYPWAALEFSHMKPQIGYFQVLDLANSAGLERATNQLDQ